MSCWRCGLQVNVILTLSLGPIDTDQTFLFIVQWSVPAFAYISQDFKPLMTLIEGILNECGQIAIKIFFLDKCHSGDVDCRST